RKQYRNEKEFWQSFSWPGPKQTGAIIKVRGAGGLDEEMTREGPWGIFRLFEAGTTTAVKDNDQVFQVTWEMTAPPVTVVMEGRPAEGHPPVPGGVLRADTGPAGQGPRLGKGKGVGLVRRGPLGGPLPPPGGFGVSIPPKPIFFGRRKRAPPAAPPQIGCFGK